MVARGLRCGYNVVAAGGINDDTVDQLHVAEVEIVDGIGAQHAHIGAAIGINHLDTGQFLREVAGDIDPRIGVGRQDRVGVGCGACVGDRVDAVIGCELVGVRAFAAIEDVVAGIAADHVISVTAIDGVVARAAADLFAGGRAGDGVVAALAVNIGDIRQRHGGEVEHVAAVVATDGDTRIAVAADCFDAVGGTETARNADPGVVSQRHDRVGVTARTGIAEDIVAVAAPGNLVGIGTVTAIHRVIARTAADHVRTQGAGDDVVAVLAIDVGDAGQRHAGEIKRAAAVVATNGNAVVAIGGDRFDARN